MYLQSLFLCKLFALLNSLITEPVAVALLINHDKSWVIYRILITLFGAHKPFVWARLQKSLSGFHMSCGELEKIRP